MDRGLRHVWHCQTGVARLRIHNAIAGTAANDLRAAGGHVDVERAMPAMAKFLPDGTVEEAIMDVTAWWPGALEWYGVDVTVRYAGATRYSGAPRRAGQAANAAEREKHRRYGRDVLPLAFEAGGRLGPASMRALQRLADAAAASSGGLLNRTALLAKWRRHLEGALLFASADAMLCALGRSQAGAQTAARWGSATPPPPPLAAHIDTMGDLQPARPPRCQGGGSPTAADSLPHASAQAQGVSASPTQLVQPAGGVPPAPGVQPRTGPQSSMLLPSPEWAPTSGCPAAEDGSLLAEGCLAEGLAALLEDDPGLDWFTDADGE